MSDRPPRFTKTLPAGSGAWSLPTSLHPKSDGAPRTDPSVVRQLPATQSIGDRAQTAIAPYVAEATEMPPEFVANTDWQRVWLATQKHSWRSLAIVPTFPGGSSLAIAERLAEIGYVHRRAAIKVLDATNLPFSQLERRMHEMVVRVACGELVILALNSVVHDPVSLTLAQAADSALLFVLLGKTDMSQAEKAVGDIGAQKFLGSVILHREAVRP